MNPNRNKNLTSLFILVFALFIVFLVFAFFTIRSLKDNDGDFDTYAKDNKNAAIAVIEITGPIMESKKIIEDLLVTENDKSIKAIIIRIDSPGGAVGPTQEIYEEIRRIDKDKPVYASFGTIAASGGYYIGAAARKIYANAGTLTGSIGVIMQFMDLSKLYEFAKVSPETIKSGVYKDAGDPSRALTPEEKQLLTGMVGEVHEQFRKDILLVRKDKIKGDFIAHTQGQVFSGEEAKKLGLVDEIGGLWSAGRKIHEEMKIKSKFGLRFIKHKKQYSLADIFENVDESLSKIKNGTFFSKMPTLLFAP